MIPSMISVAASHTDSLSPIVRSRALAIDRTEANRGTAAYELSFIMDVFSELLFLLTGARRAQKVYCERTEEKYSRTDRSEHQERKEDKRGGGRTEARQDRRGRGGHCPFPGLAVT